MIYIITYITIPDIAKETTSTLYYPESEKGEFISNYLRLKEDPTVVDLRTFRAKAEEFDIEKVLNQI